MAEDKRTSSKRVWVNAQIFNKEHPGEDIWVPDEFGVGWQIKDGAKGKLPLAVVTALEDSITYKHVIDRQTKEVKLVPRIAVVRLADDAQIDDGDENDIENAAVEEAVKDLQARGDQNPNASKKNTKKIVKQAAEEGDDEGGENE